MPAQQRAKASETRPPTNDRTPTLFPEYLEQLVTFTQAFFARAQEVASDEPDLQPMLRILAETANNTTRELADELRRTYDEANEDAKQLVERQLRLAGGLSMARAA